MTQPRSFKEALTEILRQEELALMPTSFDVIGDIAIIEVPAQLDAKRRLIGHALLKVQKSVHVILRKSSGRKGAHRTRSFQYLAGAKRLTTVHKESGCAFELNVETCYFSVREGTERLRIANLVKDGERILVMFSGVCPYAIVLAKERNVEVCAVEVNAAAHAYALENVKLNRVANRVTPLCGDVREIVPQLGKFDRVLMPLPRSAHEFLNVAIHALKKGGALHFYAVGPEEKPFNDALRALEKEAKRQRRKLRVLKQHVVLPYAPRVYKVCIDAKIL